MKKEMGDARTSGIVRNRTVVAMYIGCLTTP